MDIRRTEAADRHDFNLTFSASEWRVVYAAIGSITHELEQRERDVPERNRQILENHPFDVDKIGWIRIEDCDDRGYPDYLTTAIIPALSFYAVNSRVEASEMAGSQLSSPGLAADRIRQGEEAMLLKNEMREQAEVFRGSLPSDDGKIKELFATMTPEDITYGPQDC